MIVERNFRVFEDGNQIYMEYSTEHEGNSMSLDLSFGQAEELRDKLDEALEEDPL